MARKNKNNKNKVKSPRLPPLFITPTLRPNRPPRLTSSSSCCARGLPPDCAPPTHAAAHTGIASCIPSLSTAGNLYEEEPKILDLERKAALLPRPRLRQALTSQIGSQNCSFKRNVWAQVFVVGRLVVYLLRRSGGRAGGPRPGVGPARAARICAAPQSEGLYGCKLPGASPAHAAAAAPARPPKPLGLTPLPPRLTGCRVQPHLPARTRAPHALLQASLCCCPPRPPGAWFAPPSPPRQPPPPPFAPAGPRAPGRGGGGGSGRGDSAGDGGPNSFNTHHHVPHPTKHLQHLHLRREVISKKFKL
nr:atherin-like [Penaeus vannamei]